MKHILFECKKIGKQKMVWLTVLLSLVAAISLYFFNDSIAEKTRQQYIKKEENTLQQFEVWLEEANIELNVAKENNDEELIQEVKGSIEQFETSIQRRKEELQDFAENNWGTLYQKEIDEIELILTGAAGMGIEEQPILSFTLRVSKAELEWLQERNIEPFTYDWSTGYYHPTIYDEFTGRALETWERMTKRYGEEGLYFLYQMMPNYYITIAILIGVFIFGNTIASESRKKKRGLYFYFVQPIRKWNVFIAKYFTGLLATIGFLLFVIAMPLITSLFTKGIGSLEYPVLVYEGAIPNSFGDQYTQLSVENDQFHFIPMSEYVLKAVLLALVLAFFLYTLYLLTSFFIKSPTVNLLIVGALSFGGMKVLPSSEYNPFTYLDVHRVINGELAALAINPSIQFQNGAILLGSVGLLLVMLNIIIFRLWRN